MRQRQLRLGDILDDYCPRERRITNHAVVAMIDGKVKQTRCTTCDHEHPYKEAKVPARRPKRDEPAALYKKVLAGMPEPAAVKAPTGPAIEPDVDRTSAPDEQPADEQAPAIETASVSDDTPAPPDVPEVEERPAESVHRPLIRATLARKEGEPRTPPPRPEFTIHQRGVRRDPLMGNQPPQRGGPARGGFPRGAGSRPATPAHGAGRLPHKGGFGGGPQGGRSDHRSHPSAPGKAPARRARFARDGKKRSR
jgi:hypothetical protein